MALTPEDVLNKTFTQTSSVEGTTSGRSTTSLTTSSPRCDG